jgi:hypothetical protein
MSFSTRHPQSGGGAGKFATTRWSVVQRAGDSHSPECSAALESLCSSYWYPLYVFVRGSGHGPEEARDLTQGFFARLLEKNGWARVARGAGWMKTCRVATFGRTSLSKLGRLFSDAIHEGIPFCLPALWAKVSLRCAAGRPHFGLPRLRAKGEFNAAADSQPRCAPGAEAAIQP